MCLLSQDSLFLGFVFFFLPANEHLHCSQANNFPLGLSCGTPSGTPVTHTALINNNFPSTISLHCVGIVKLQVLYKVKEGNGHLKVCFYLAYFTYNTVRTGPVHNALLS